MFAQVQTSSALAGGARCPQRTASAIERSEPNVHGLGPVWLRPRAPFHRVVARQTDRRLCSTVDDKVGDLEAVGPGIVKRMPNQRDSQLIALRQLLARDVPRIYVLLGREQIQPGQMLSNGGQGLTVAAGGVRGRDIGQEVPLLALGLGDVHFIPVPVLPPL